MSSSMYGFNRSPYKVGVQVRFILTNPNTSNDWRREFLLGPTLVPPYPVQYVPTLQWTGAVYTLEPLHV